MADVKLPCANIPLTLEKAAFAFLSLMGMVVAVARSGFYLKLINSLLFFNALGCIIG